MYLYLIGPQSLRSGDDLVHYAFRSIDACLFTLFANLAIKRLRALKADAASLVAQANPVCAVDYTCADDASRLNLKTTPCMML
uniref:Uncharacterized protein n=1 Tax=Trichuris muris TaxID=70415 RepID=A0A5S6QQU1_TRIMR